MKKKIYWMTLPTLATLSLPALTVIACASEQKIRWAKSEMGEFAFLMFKESLTREALQRSLSEAELLQKDLLSIHSVNQITNAGLESLQIRAGDNGFFIVDYQLKVFVGKMQDYMVSDPRFLPKEREILKGTLQVKAKDSN